MIDFADVGVYIVAPVMSTLTAGGLMFAGRYFMRTGRILSDLEARVQNNEDDIEYIEKRVNQIAQKVS